jgi:sigma-70-like protein
VLTYDTQAHALRREPHGDLLRQAYLLTGDPERAHELANRAARTVEAQAYRLGPAEALESAKEELVRSYVADPGRPPPVATAGPTPHPDVAMWRAICRLAPRRRAAIMLRYDEGLSEEHAAARMDTTPRLLRADVDAAMLTLRTAVPGVADPWMRVADALAAAGRGWSDYTRPAAARVAEVLSAPAPTPSPRPAHGATAVRRSPRSPRPVALAAGAVAAVLLAAAIVVPRLGGGDDPAVADAGPAAGQTIDSGTVRGAPRPVVPSIDVADGLLNWPARGRLATDGTLLAAATKAWRAGVPAAEAPASAIGVLWAGSLDRQAAAVLQGLDQAGRPHLAQVVGATRTTVRLQHAEPLHPGTQVLTLLPPKGPSGVVRVLVSPEGQVADGLLASNPMDGKPFQHATVGDDGVSGVLPSPPGVPTCSRVVLLGLDSGRPGASGARVLYSGIMTAEMLAGMPDKVEVGSPTLAPDRDALPETQWFTDGTKLAAKVPGQGTLTVAALGPRLADRPLDHADKRTVSSRAYELRRGGSTWVGSVVDVDGKTVCASAMPAGSAPEPTAWALRCPIPGEMMPGIAHVVGAPHAQTVEVDLLPTKSPAGQERFAATAHRADDQPLDQAFAAIQVAPMGFPCGTGTLRVHSGRAVTGVSLPVYTP